MPDVNTLLRAHPRVVLAIDCSQCAGTGSVHGPRYEEYGELVPCPICDGKRTEPVHVSLAELRIMLELGSS